MKIIDLSPNYLKFLAGETSFEEYRSSYPEFFDHYAKFWSGDDNFLPALTFGEVESRRSLLFQNLSEADARLRKNEFLTEDVSAILFVGNNSANGHAFLDDGNPVAWFAIECFESELEAKIFIMHELIHALHYAACPEFAFENAEQQKNISRQIITEGIATYLTKRLWNVTDETALWADKIPTEQLHSWMVACKNSKKELFQFVAAHFELSDPSIEIFYTVSSEDIYSYRAGYYAGLKLIESIAYKYDFSNMDLLNIPMKEMKQLVWNELQSLGAK